MTTQQISWVREGNTLWLSGKLNQKVLNVLWNIRFEMMQDIILIDLSAVIDIDTVGIALLAHLVDVGKRQGASVMLTGVSDSILILSQLYNLPNDILPC